jgi:hypothetical protein
MASTPFHFVIAVLLLFVFAGCEAASTSEPASKQIRSPGVGSYFVYRAVDYDNNMRENEVTLRMDTHRVIATNFDYYGRKTTKVSKLLDTIYYSYTADGNIERFEENALGWVPMPVTSKDTLATYFDLREAKGYEVQYTAAYVGEEQIAVSGEPLDVVKIKYSDHSWSWKGEGLTEYLFYYSKKLGVLVKTESLPWRDGSYSYWGGNSRLIRFEMK